MLGRQDFGLGDFQCGPRTRNHFSKQWHLKVRTRRSEIAQGEGCCAGRRSCPCPPYLGLSFLKLPRTLAFVVWANERPSCLFICLLLVDLSSLNSILLLAVLAKLGLTFPI